MPPETSPADRRPHLERLIDETPFMLTRCSRNLRYVFVSRSYAHMVAVPVKGRSGDVLGGLFENARLFAAVQESSRLKDDFLARIVSGKLRLNMQAVDFPDVVRSAVDAVSPAADAKSVRIETVLDPQASPVSGDPERLQQILWNLLSNAVKFLRRPSGVMLRRRRSRVVHLRAAATGSASVRAATCPCRA